MLSLKATAAPCVLPSAVFTVEERKFIMSGHSKVQHFSSAPRINDSIKQVDASKKFRVAHPWKPSKQLTLSCFCVICFHLLSSKQQTQRRHVALVQGDSERRCQGITGCCVREDSRLRSSWLAFKSVSRHHLSHGLLWGARGSNVNPP